MKTYFINSLLDRVSNDTVLKNLERSLEKGLYSYDEYVVERGACSSPIMSFSGELLFDRKGRVVGNIYTPQHAVIAGEKIGEAMYELLFFHKPKQQLITNYWYMKKADFKDSVGGDYAGFISRARQDKVVFDNSSLLKLFLRIKK